MRLAWLTDLHLNFVSRRKLDAFLDEVRAQRPDAILLGGDVAEAETVADSHRRAEERLPELAGRWVGCYLCSP